MVSRATPGAGSSSRSLPRPAARRPRVVAAGGAAHSARHHSGRGPGIAVIVSAHNEVDRLRATLAGLNSAFPGARIVVGDDASDDGTAALARAGAAES